MIDINVVREKYSSMSDNELISFNQSEGHLLTDAGSKLLQEELIKRNLGNSTEFENKNELSPDASDLFITSNWSYAFDQKEYGKNNEEIVIGLIESGMDDEHAHELVSKMNIAAKQRLMKAELERLVGVLTLTCGIAITFLPLSMPSNRVTYIIAGCAILIGALKSIKGIYNISRFKKIINTIGRENNH